MGGGPGCSSGARALSLGLQIASGGLRKGSWSQRSLPHQDGGHARVFLIKLWLLVSEGEGSLQVLHAAGQGVLGVPSHFLQPHMRARRVRSVDPQELTAFDILDL